MIELARRITRFSGPHPGLPKAMINLAVSEKKPLVLTNGRFEEIRGVFVHGHDRQAAIEATFFCPADLIRAKLHEQHGPDALETYVYSEGFSNDRTIDFLAPEIRKDDFGWSAERSEPFFFRVSELQINQPGVDLWRLLTLQLREGRDPSSFLYAQSPPSLGIKLAPDPAIHLLAGNHRALLALANGLPCLPLETVSVRSRLIKTIKHDQSPDPYHHDYESTYLRNRFALNLEAQQANVRALFGCSDVRALAYSFLDQLFAALS